MPTEIINLADFLIGVVVGAVAGLLLEIYRMWKGKDD